MGKASKNIDDETLKLIMGVHENKFPRYNGLHAELEFQKVRLKKAKKKGIPFSLVKARDVFLTKNGYMVKFRRNNNVFSKTEGEKRKLKIMKKICTFQDGTK